MKMMPRCNFGCCDPSSSESNDENHACHPQAYDDHAKVDSTGSSSSSESSEDSEDSIEDPEVLRLRHTRFKDHGSQRRRWMEDPNEPNCFIPQVTLSWETISSTYDLTFAALPIRYVKSDNIPDHQVLNLDPNLDYLEGSWIFERFAWWGYTAPSAMVIMGIRRDKDSTAPRMSEICHAIYTKDQPTDSLKQVYVCLVENEETLPFVKRHVYTEANNLTWPTSGEQIWDSATNTDMFDMILGTRIGKVVSYLALGSFPRGTQHIKRIVTAPSFADTVHLRFDIEPME
jgi:hypothetical protein